MNATVFAVLGIEKYLECESIFVNKLRYEKNKTSIVIDTSVDKIVSEGIEVKGVIMFEGIEILTDTCNNCVVYVILLCFLLNIEYPKHIHDTLTFIERFCLNWKDTKPAEVVKNLAAKLAYYD